MACRYTLKDGSVVDANELKKRLYDGAFDSLLLSGKSPIKLSPKTIINAITGVTKPPSMVTVNERQALKDQLRLEAQAAREGYRQARKEQKSFSDRIKDMLSNTKIAGQLTTAQTKSLLNKARAVNSDATMDKFMDYATRIIDDANYAERINKIEALQDKLRNKVWGRNITKVKDFLRISPENLPDATLSAYESALESMNQKVPDLNPAFTLLPTAKVIHDNAEAQYLSNKQQKQQANIGNTYQDLLSASDEVMNRTVNDADEAMQAVKDMRKIANKAQSLLDEGLITEDEFAAIHGDLNNPNKLGDSVRSKLKDVNKALIPKITSAPIDESNMSAEEKKAVANFRSLKPEQLDTLAPDELQNALDIIDRINTGHPYAAKLQEIYNKAVANTESTKIASQINDNIGDATKGNSKEVVNMLNVLEPHQWEAKLRIAGGKFKDAVYNTVNKAMKGIGKYHKDVADMLDEFHNSVYGTGITSWLSNAKAKWVYKRDISAIAAGMVQKAVEEAALAHSLNPKVTDATRGNVGNRDEVGALLGNEAELSKYDDTFRRQMEMQRNGLGKTILKKYQQAYDTLPKRADGTLDIQKIANDVNNGNDMSYLNPLSKKILSAYRNLNETRLRPMQTMANELAGRDIELLDEYMKHKPLVRQQGEVSTLMDRLQNNVLSFKSGSGQARTNNNVKALELNLEKLAHEAIEETALDYNLTDALRHVNDTFAKAASKVSSSEGKALLDGIRKQTANNIKAQFQHEQMNVVGRLATKLTNSLTAKVLTTIPRIAAEGVSAPFMILRAMPKDASLSDYKNSVDYGMTKDIMESTGSTLLKKAKGDIDRNFEAVGKAGVAQPSFLNKMAHLANGITELVFMPSLYMPNFNARFRELTGEDFDYKRFKQDASYRSDYKQDIESAASFADRQVKQILGGTTEAEKSENIDIFGNLIKAPRQNTWVKATGLGWLQSYPYRDMVAVQSGLRDVAMNYNEGRLQGAKVALGTLGMGIAYQLSRDIFRALWNSKTGDEKQKAEALTFLHDYDGKKAVKDLALGAAQTAFGGYTAAQRVTMIPALSALYNATDDEESKKYIGQTLNDLYHVRPNSFKRFAGSKQQNINEFFVNLVPALSSATKNVQETWGSVESMMDDYKAHGFEGWGDEKKDTFKWINFLLTTLDAGMAVSNGSAIPKDLNDAVKKRLSEGDAKSTSTSNESSSSGIKKIHHLH